MIPTETESTGEVAHRYLARPRVVSSAEELRRAVNLLLRQDFIVIDTETDGLDFITNEVIWVGLSSMGQRYLIPMSHPNGSEITPSVVVEEPDPSTVRPYKLDPTRFTKPKMMKVSYPATFEPPPEQIRPDIAFSIMEPLFFAYDGILVGHNLKFDLKSIAKYYGGKLATGQLMDTILLIHMLDENKRSYSLKELIPNWVLGLAAQNPEIRRKFYPELGKAGIKNFSIDDIAKYLQLDITYTQWLYTHFYAELDRSLRETLHFEMDVYRVVMQMEYDGVAVDPVQMKSLADVLDKEIAEYATEVYRLTGSKWTLTNVDMQKQFLFGPKSKGGQGLKPKGMTKTGKPKLDKAALADFAEVNPVAHALSEWKERYKLQSTFVAPYTDVYIHPKTGRTHASFKQHGTATSRFSSADPNLQQIPAHSELGSQFRKAFIPQEGGLFVVADYDQIELRCIAYDSGDRAMIDLLDTGEDIHTGAAAAMFEVAPEDVTKELRAVGKTVNFLVGYGGGAKRLAVATKRDLKECEVFIRRYYERFSALPEWKNRIIAEAVTRGDRMNPIKNPPYVVIPPYGRRRRLPDLFSNDEYEIFRAQRQAVNAVIQGFASYIMKTAMVDVSHLLSDSQAARIVVQVHDEMVVEVLDKDYAPEVYGLVIMGMEGVEVNGKPALGRVPLLASGGIGSNWVEAKESS